MLNDMEEPTKTSPFHLSHGWHVPAELVLSCAVSLPQDRRKDALLQENGYFVLRFLAEDIGKRLDEILDTILRAVVHRRKC